MLPLIIGCVTPVEDAIRPAASFQAVPEVVHRYTPVTAVVLVLARVTMNPLPSPLTVVTVPDSAGQATNTTSPLLK